MICGPPRTIFRKCSSEPGLESRFGRKRPLHQLALHPEIFGVLEGISEDLLYSGLPTSIRRSSSRTGFQNLLFIVP